MVCCRLLPAVWEQGCEQAPVADDEGQVRLDVDAGQDDAPGAGIAVGQHLGAQDSALGIACGRRMGVLRQLGNRQLPPCPCNIMLQYLGARPGAAVTYLQGAPAEARLGGLQMSAMSLKHVGLVAVAPLRARAPPVLALLGGADVRPSRHTSSAATSTGGSMCGLLTLGRRSSGADSAAAEPAKRHEGQFAPSHLITLQGGPRPWYAASTGSWHTQRAAMQNLGSLVVLTHPWSRACRSSSPGPALGRRAPESAQSRRPRSSGSASFCRRRASAHSKRPNQHKLCTRGFQRWYDSATHARPWHLEERRAASAISSSSRAASPVRDALPEHSSRLVACGLDHPHL
jgi:hypothetical protein